MPSSRVTSTNPPFRLHLAALSSRLLTAREIRSASTPHQRGLDHLMEGERRRSPARPLDCVVHDRVEPDVAGLGARFAAPGQLDHVAHQRGELVELLDHVGPQSGAVLGREQLLLAHQLKIGSDRRDRGSQLVRCVGHQIALGLHRALERVERAVERASQTGELVRTHHVESLVLDPLRVGRDRLGLAGEARDRDQRRPRHQEPEQRCEQDAGPADHQRYDQLTTQRIVDRGQRQRDRQSTTRPDSRDQRPDVGAFHAHVREELAVAAARHGLDGRGRRYLVCLPVGDVRLPVRLEQRERPGGTPERLGGQAVDP